MKYLIIILLWAVVMTNCKTMEKTTASKEVTIYCYPLTKFTKIPITIYSIKSAAEDTFVYSDKKGLMGRIVGALEVSPNVADSVFLKGQVRVAITTVEYAPIYLDRASHIMYNEKIYVCTDGLYSMLSQFFPANKRSRYLDCQ